MENLNSSSTSTHNHRHVGTESFASVFTKAMASYTCRVQRTPPIPPDRLIALLILENCVFLQWETTEGDRILLPLSVHKAKRLKPIGYRFRSSAQIRLFIGPNPKLGEHKRSLTLTHVHKPTAMLHAVQFYIQKQKLAEDLSTMETLQRDLSEFPEMTPSSSEEHDEFSPFPSSALAKDTTPIIKSSPQVKQQPSATAITIGTEATDANLNPLKPSSILFSRPLPQPEQPLLQTGESSLTFRQVTADQLVSIFSQDSLARRPHPPPQPPKSVTFHQQQLQMEGSSHSLRSFKQESGKHHMLHRPVLSSKAPLLETSFACALIQYDVLPCPGKLCVTNSHLVFTSPLLQTAFIIFVSSIRSLQRAFQLFLNGFMLYTEDGDPHVFMFFSEASREEALKAVQRAMHPMEDDSKDSKEASQTTDKGGNGAVGLLQQTSGQSTAAARTGGTASIQIAAEDRAVFEGVDPPPLISDSPEWPSLNEMDRFKTDRGDEFAPIARLLENPCTPKPVVYPSGLTLDNIVSLMILSKRVVMVQSVAHKDRDSLYEPWKACKLDSYETGEVVKSAGVRHYHAQIPVRVMRVSYYHLDSYERYALGRDGSSKIPSLLLHITTKVSGVPYADTFRTESLTLWKEVAPGQVHAQAYCYVQIFKSTMMTGKIKSTSVKETINVSTSLDALLIKEAGLADGGGGASDLATVTEEPEESWLDSIMGNLQTAGEGIASVFKTLLAQRDLLLRLLLALSLLRAAQLAHSLGFVLDYPESLLSIATLGYVYLLEPLMTVGFAFILWRLLSK